MASVSDRCNPQCQVTRLEHWLQSSNRRRSRNTRPAFDTRLRHQHMKTKWRSPLSGCAGHIYRSSRRVGSCFGTSPKHLKRHGRWKAWMPSRNCGLRSPSKRLRSDTVRELAPKRKPPQLPDTYPSAKCRNSANGLSGTISTDGCCLPQRSSCEVARTIHASSTVTSARAILGIDWRPGIWRIEGCV
jgi:hypothetical protein